MVAVALIAGLTACTGGGRPTSKAGGGAQQVGAPADADLHGGVVTSSMYIDRAARETFAPPAAGMTPRLTPKQVWQGRGGIPAATAYQLGTLTLPPQHNDVLAWGFRTGPVRCVYTGMYQPKHPPDCYRWTFYSATSGHLLDSTEQEVGLTHVTPTPIPTARLLQAGFIPGVASRFAPALIEYQAPESVIQWTFDQTRCQIRERWFSSPANASTSAQSPCLASRQFSVDVAAILSGHGGGFEVVAGHQAHRYGEFVRATLANGQTESYGQQTDGAWIFVVQRCGPGSAGTAITRIDEVTAKGRRVIASQPVAIKPAACPIDSATSSS